MSRENVETLRACFEAVASEGPQVLVRDFAHPAIEWQVRGDLPDAGNYRGHAGLLALLAGFDDAFQEQGYEPQEFIDAGDSVIVPLYWWGRGRGSSLTISERRETWVFEVQDGKIVRVREFPTKAEAFDAAGFRE